MAERVTGKFGEEEIVLNNAASEATLEKLLEAIDKSAKKSDKEKTEQKAELKRFTEKLKDGTATLGDFTKAAGSAAKAAAASVGRGFNNVGDAAAGLASEFATGSARISDFSSHITGLINQIPLIGGALGGPLQLFASFVDNNVDTFRQLSTVGVDFGNTIFATQEAAIRARLALETFSGAVSQNSRTLALLGGNASRGAEIFTNVSRRVQNEFIPSLAALGLTMEETAAYQGDYLDIQTRLGLAQQRDQQALGNQTREYVKQIDLLAKVTGEQREQISEQLKQQALDKRIQGLLATLAPEAKKVLQNTAAALETQSPDIANAFKNMVATGGVPMTEFGRDLVRLNPRLQELTAGVRSGTVSQEQVFEEFRRTARIANAQGDSFLQFTGTLAALGSEVGSATLAMLGFENFAEGFNEAQQDQITAMEEGGKAFATFESAIVQARNAILGQLLDSGIFDSLQSTFADFIKYLTGPGLGDIERIITQFSTYLDGMFDKLSDPDYTFGDLIAELGTDALKYISPLFVLIAKEGIKAIGIAIKELFSNPVVAVGTAGAIAALFGAGKVIGALVGGIGSLFTSAVVKRAMATNINSMFTGGRRNRGGAPAGGVGPRAPRVGKGLGLLGLGFGAYDIATTVGNENLTRQQKTTDIAGTVGGLGFGAAGVKAGAALGLAGGPFAPITVPLGALTLGTLGYFAGEDVGEFAGYHLSGGYRNANGNTTSPDRVTDEQLERLDTLVSFTPKVNNLSESLNTFQSSFNSMDLDYRQIDRTVRSLEKMTEQLEDINEQLQGGNDSGFFGFGGNDRNQTTAGDVLSNFNSNQREQLEQLNRVMTDILGVLLQSNDMNKRQLNATRAMTGNLY